MSVELGIIVAALVLFGNAFFVGAEFALVSARRSNIELLALDGSRAAKITLSAMEQVSLMLAGAQLGITVCSLIFGAVGEPLLAHALEGPFHEAGVPDFLLHPIAFAVALSVMVYLHVVIGEMVPKNLSLAASTKAALRLVPPLWLFVQINRPVVFVLNSIANATVRLLGVKPKQEMRSSFSRDEVAGFVKESHREGLLSEEEESLLSGTLDFEAGTVGNVVIPMDKIVFAKTTSTPADIEQLSVKTGYSRFPVRDKRNELKGYIHLKDILQLSENAYTLPFPQRLIRELSTMKIDTAYRDALAIMKESGTHIASVCNRQKKVVGIIMLEDVLEELVGPLNDDA